MRRPCSVRENCPVSILPPTVRAEPFVSNQILKLFMRRLARWVRKWTRATDDDGHRWPYPHPPTSGIAHPQRLPGPRLSFPSLKEPNLLPSPAHGAPTSSEVTGNTSGRNPSKSESLTTSPSLRAPRPAGPSSAPPISRPFRANEPGLLLSDQDLHLLDFPDAPPVAIAGCYEIYLAVHRPSGLKLAMKRMKFILPTNDMLRHLRREAATWSEFRHPNVLPFFGTMKIKDRLYFVSPWGLFENLCTLSRSRIDTIQQNDGLFERSARSVFRYFNEAKIIQEIAAGLSYLHALDAIHGNMKAANVLLDGEGRAQICNFALTKTLDRAVSSAELKDIGSIRWQSPELLENEVKSSKSDVWAFGMTISEVLTGHYPLAHLEQQAAVLVAILMRNERPVPQPPSRLGVDFEPLWKIAAMCWKTQPENRPSMQEVLQALELIEVPLLPPASEALYSANPPTDEADPPEPVPDSHETQSSRDKPTAQPPKTGTIQNLHIQTSKLAHIHQKATIQNDALPHGSRLFHFDTVDDTLITRIVEPSNRTEDASAPIACASSACAGLWLSDKDSHLLDFSTTNPVATGGFCTMYIATHRPDGAKLAMKCLGLNHPSEDILRRFQREAKTWSGFQHPNILPFFGFITVDHSLYLLSPWRSLGDLLAFVQARIKFIKESDGPMPPWYSKFNEMRAILEIAAGLEYLHSIRAIHGDLKGKNVLLDDEGCAQICDFGLTKTPEDPVTSKGQRGVGSIRWQSPELFDDSPKSSASDVYAFGMTIAEVLTGNYPFPDLMRKEAIMAAILAHKKRPKPQPSQRQGVDFRPLWNLAAECWKTEVGDRPSMTAILRYMNLLELPIADRRSDEVALHHYDVALRQLRASSTRSELERQSELGKPPQLPETLQYMDID